MIDGTGERRVIALTTTVHRESGSVCAVRFVPAPLATTIAVGRSADLQIGAEPDDTGVSRRALTVTSARDDWQIEFSNRNGAELRLWAQRAEWIGYGDTRRVKWPRAAIRIYGHDADRAFWVLLEADDMQLAAPPPMLSEALETQVESPPRALTMPQMAAVQAVFADHFAWPPRVQPQERSLEAAGARLQIGPSAVRERLAPVQERARRLGLRGELGITDPSYVFHLVRHGYISDLPAPVAAEPA